MEGHIDMIDDDKKAIHKLVDDWFAETTAGDLEVVLDLMTDDVVFLVPGRAPFGKEQFAADSQAMAGMRIEGESEIAELEVLGDRAWMRNHLHITVTTPSGEHIVRSGYTLTILRKENGRWRIARDANLLSSS